MRLRTEDLGQAYPPSASCSLHHSRRGGVPPWRQRLDSSQLGSSCYEAAATKQAIQFIPALVVFLGYDPEPVYQGTLAGRLVAKRLVLGLSQQEAARCLATDPGTWVGWEGGAEIVREAHRRAVDAFLGSDASWRWSLGEWPGGSVVMLRGVARARPIVGGPVLLPGFTRPCSID
jgi:hypothetical protein